MIPPFVLHRPASVEEASGLMRELDDASFYCGGTELTLLLKMGLATFDHLVDIKRIPELGGIDRSGPMLRIGAAVTHAEVEYSPLVQAFAPGLVELEEELANVRVRHTGTLGGNLCFAEPHSDPAPFLIAWDAELELADADRRRVRPADGFFVAPLETDRADDELLIAIRLPELPPATTVVHRKVAFVERPAASIGVRLGVGEGVFRHVRIAVGSVGDIPQLLPGAAALVEGADPARSASIFHEAAEIAAESADIYEDVNGSVPYKRHLVRVLVRQGLERAYAEVVA